MDRFVVMVDAGYLLHKAVEIFSNNASTDRRCLELTDPPGLIRLLVDKTKAALEITRGQLLRVYWYDGVLPGGPTPVQRSILRLPDVSLRPGAVNSNGQQKGVDSLIVIDLLELASNGAVTDVAVVTGDGDLALGIELAQKMGVRVAAIGLAESTTGISAGQSRAITDRADRISHIGRPELAAVMRYVPIKKRTHKERAATAAAKLTSLTSAETACIDSAVEVFVLKNAPSVNVVNIHTKQIDPQIDRLLMEHAHKALALPKLTPSHKMYARACFRKKLGL